MNSKALWLIGCCGGIALVAEAPAAQAEKSAPEILAIAQQVTVQIETRRNGELAPGSGFLVQKQGDLYTVATNNHVVCTAKVDQCSMALITPDGQRHPIDAKSVRSLASQGIDLATVQFRSERTYTLATPGSSDNLQVGDRVYTAGFPSQQRQLSFNSGEVQGAIHRFNLNDGDTKGYGVIYDAYTLPGMSGSAVFDRAGRVVAIHGRGDRYQPETDSDDTNYDSQIVDSYNRQAKIGTNRGIPVRFLLANAAKLQITGGDRPWPALGPEPAPTLLQRSDEQLITGYNLWVAGNKSQAQKYFTKAIQLYPQSSRAYLMRGYVAHQRKDYRVALADYDRAVQYDPKYVMAYYLRGNLKSTRLADQAGAIADYDRVISLRPEWSIAYNNRAVARQNLGDLPGALADLDRSIALAPDLPYSYTHRALIRATARKDTTGAMADLNRAITLDPKLYTAYYGRGLLKANFLNDYSGAIADYDQALAINSRYALAYGGRAMAKGNVDNFAGALADYNQAIALQPRTADHYVNRGVLKFSKLQDSTGGLADLNQAIALDPQNVTAYFARGFLKANFLQDRPGGIRDLQQAAKLERRQKTSTGLLPSILQQLQALGAME
jgi:tetratricopeptide (TPR) repeat protein